jgi:hypothetical protein
MRARSIGLAFAALLLLGRSVPGHAQDAASKSLTAPPAAPGPTAAPTEAPASIPRPSIAPKTAEPAPAAEEAKPRRHRRHTRHHYKRYAYWRPFPIYLPRFHRRGISWHRIRWFF